MIDEQVLGIRVNLETHRFYNVVTNQFVMWYKSNRYTITIEKELKQIMIQIVLDKPHDSSAFVDLFLNIHCFNMLFEGSFYKIKEIYFLEDNGEFIKKTEIIDGLVDCYNSHNQFEKDLFWLGNLKEEAYKNILNKWNELFSDITLLHNVYLYSNCSINFPVDLRFFLQFQCFEPLAGLLKRKGIIDYSAEADMNEKMESVIEKYGGVVFKKENDDGDTEAIVSKMINTRVRVAHSKNKCNVLNGEQCWEYTLKLSIMYRLIILDLLGISPDCFLERVNNATEQINNSFNANNGGAV